MAKPKVITVCGSSKFVDIMAVLSWFLEKEEGALVWGLHLLPYWYSTTPIPDHLAEHEGVDKHMDALHLSKIDASDEVFVVDWGGYVGESTRAETNHARSKGIPTRYITQEPYEARIRKLMENCIVAEGGKDGG